MDCGRRRRLRPAQKCCSAKLGQGVDSPLDRGEPPVDVAAYDFGSVWYVFLKVSGTSRALRQRGGAGEGALAIRGHDRHPRPSAFNRIAPSAAMLLDETRSAAGVLAWHWRSRTHQHVDLTIRSHSKQAKTEPSAKVPKPRVVLTPLLARRKASGEPNFVACRGAIDPLQNELEVEGQLELANHDDRRIIAPQRKQIAASDFTFDNEAEPFEEGLDWPIEERLQNCSPGSSQLEPSFVRLRLQSLKRRNASSSNAMTTEVMLRTPDLAAVTAVGIAAQHGVCERTLLASFCSLMRATIFVRSSTVFANCLRLTKLCTSSAMPSLRDGRLARRVCQNLPIK